jgi:hypothetical protein
MCSWDLGAYDPHPPLSLDAPHSLILCQRLGDNWNFAGSQQERSAVKAERILNNWRGSTQILQGLRLMGF